MERIPAHGLEVQSHCSISDWEDPDIFTDYLLQQLNGGGLMCSLRGFVRKYGLWVTLIVTQVYNRRIHSSKFECAECWMHCGVDYSGSEETGR